MGFAKYVLLLDGLTSPPPGLREGLCILWDILTINSIETRQIWHSWFDKTISLAQWVQTPPWPQGRKIMQAEFSIHTLHSSKHWEFGENSSEDLLEFFENVVWFLVKKKVLVTLVIAKRDDSLALADNCKSLSFGRGWDRNSDKFSPASSEEIVKTHLKTMKFQQFFKVLIENNINNW